MVVGLHGLVGELCIGDLIAPGPKESSIPQTLLCCVLVGIVLLKSPGQCSQGRLGRYLVSQISCDFRSHRF